MLIRAFDLGNNESLDHLVELGYSNFGFDINRRMLTHNSLCIKGYTITTGFGFKAHLFEIACCRTSNRAEMTHGGLSLSSLCLNSVRPINHSHSHMT